MKKHQIYLYVFTFLLSCVFSLPVMADKKDDGSVRVEDVSVQRANNRYNVTMQLVLDDLHVKSNHQLFLTPCLESADGVQKAMLPTVVFSGRNMHYVYLRSGKTKATGKTNYNIRQELWHKPGTQNTISYSESIAMEPWMQNHDTRLVVAIDTCGCGVPTGHDIAATQIVNTNPAAGMVRMPFPRPEVGAVGRIISHNGRARVQFEVNHIELHEQPYVCKNGQRIDNRSELKVIDDSIHYALNDPNVEIQSIVICGYASPESPYEHNNYLASNRSRALTEYIERKYNLPHERCTYTAVTENWGEFRDQVVAAKDITEQQRKDLLALIDRPAYSPAEYDQKETELKTSPKFAKLYKEKILPLWFPHLRATSFTINTQLKPMTDMQLRDVLKKTPKLMSLNEIYRAANTYEHGSAEWQNAMAVALREFPDDPIANCNAAALAVEQKDYAAAAKYLQKAGDSDDANILRGIVATHNNDYDAARRFFMKAKNNPEAQRNIQLLK